MTTPSEALEPHISEAELQRTILDAFDTYGWLVFHDHDSRKNRSGFPDICAIHPKTGWLVFYELKTKTGQVKPTQAKWLDALWREHAHRIVRLVRPAELDKTLAEIAAMSKTQPRSSP